MNNKWNIVLLVIGIAGALFIGKMVYDYYFPRYQVETGDTIPPIIASEDEEGEDNLLAPDFKVYDRDGNSVSFSDFEGRPIIINFWASWCSPCTAEMPDFELLYGEYSSDITFMMINVTDGNRETREKAEKLIDKEGYTFPVYFDEDLDAASIYGIDSLPTTVFIDAEGNIITGYKARLNESTIRSAIDLILE